MRVPALRHLLSLLPPAMPAVFVATAPHRWGVALAMLSSPFLLVGMDLLSGRARSPPEASSRGGSDWPFDVLLVVHAAIHFALLAGYLRLAQREGAGSADFWVGAVLVGHNAGWSAIIVGHELIRPPEPGVSAPRARPAVHRVLRALLDRARARPPRARRHRRRPCDGALRRDASSASSGGRSRRSSGAPGASRPPARRRAHERLWDPRLLRSRVVHGSPWSSRALAAAIRSSGSAAPVARARDAGVAGDRPLETRELLRALGAARAHRRVSALDSWDTELGVHPLRAHRPRPARRPPRAPASRPYQTLRHATRARSCRTAIRPWC